MADSDQNQATPDHKGIFPSTQPGFVRRVFVVVLILLVVVGLVLVVWHALKVWFILLAGILLAILFRTLGDYISKYLRVPEPWSVLLALLLLLGILAGTGWLLAKPIAVQVGQFQEQFPESMERVQKTLQRMGIDLSALSIPNRELTALTGQWLSKAAGVFQITLEALAGAFVVLFLGIYLAINPHSYFEGFLSLFPPGKRPRLRTVLEEVCLFLRYWLLGQLISMTVVGILIGLGLYFIGIPFSLVLGILAGILDFIPILGPILAAVPAVLLGFAHSPLTALYVVIVFIVANQIESHLLVPWIHKYTVSLPPALTVFALSLMGLLFGFLGILLAAPLTATCMVLIKRLYIEDVLERPNGSSG